MRSKFLFYPHRAYLIILFLSGLIILTLPPGNAFSILRENDKLIVCISTPIVSLDPTNYRDRTTQTVIKNIFDSLTTLDNNMQVVPQLAESWENLDATTWEFKLRRGVKFHNGSNLTARDVKFTLDRVIEEGAMDGKTSPRKELLGPVVGVRAVDDYTIQIQTRRPWAILPLMLTLQEIIPEEYMKSVGSAEFQKSPIGTGPFRFITKQNGDQLVLERFEKYYRNFPADRRIKKPPPKRVIFQTVPERIKRIAMLKKGECDIITQIMPESVPLLETVPGIHVVTRPPTRSYFAEINCAKTYFNDPRIRRAMNYAVDIHAVIEILLQGRGEVLPTILLPNAFAYHSSQKPYAYNPELAKKLLAEAGFAEHFPVVINCTEDNRPFANVIALFLTKVGMRPVISMAARDKPEILGEKAPWDIIVNSWGNSTLDPSDILEPKFQTKGQGNYSGYSNEEVDRLLSEAENTLDSNKRELDYQKVQEIIFNDAPMIFGYAADELYGVRDRIKNFIPSPSGMMNMHDVYLETGD